MIVEVNRPSELPPEQDFRVASLALTSDLDFDQNVAAIETDEEHFGLFLK